jgi:hypothetical protein
MAVIRVGVECQRAQAPSSQPHLSVGMRPSTPNPSPRGRRRFRPNLSKIYQYDLYWPLSPTLCFLHMLCGKWKCKGRRKGLYMVVGFLCKFNKIFIIKVFSHPKHTSHLTLSLGGKVDSRSYLASMAKAGSNTKTQGKGRKDSSH